MRHSSEIYSIRDWYRGNTVNKKENTESEIYSIRDWYIIPKGLVNEIFRVRNLLYKRLIPALLEPDQSAFNRQKFTL